MKFIAIISVVLFIGLWTAEAVPNFEDYAKEYKDAKKEVLSTTMLLDPSMTYFNLDYLSQIKKEHPEVLESTLFDMSLEYIVELANTSPDECGRRKFKEITYMISLLCPGSDRSNLKAYLEDIRERFTYACSDLYYKRFKF